MSTALQTVLSLDWPSQDKQGGNGEGKPSLLDRARLVPDSREVLAFSSEEQEIMEVPSCKLRAVVTHPGPGQRLWSGTCWKNLGAPR